MSSSCAGCFAGLSCSARTEIINLLQEKKKMSVMEIAKHFNLSQPTITHHLQYLAQAGILTSKKVGRKTYYFIDPQCGNEACGIFK